MVFRTILRVLVISVAITMSLYVRSHQVILAVQISLIPLLCITENSTWQFHNAVDAFECSCQFSNENKKSARKTTIRHLNGNHQMIGSSKFLCSWGAVLKDKAPSCSLQIEEWDLFALPGMTWCAKKKRQYVQANNHRHWSDKDVE